MSRYPKRAFSANQSFFVISLVNTVPCHEGPKSPRNTNVNAKIVGSIFDYPRKGYNNKGTNK